MSKKSSLSLIISAVGLLTIVSTLPAEATNTNIRVPRPDASGRQFAPCHWGRVQCRTPDGSLAPRRRFICPPHRDNEVMACPGERWTR